MFLPIDAHLPTVLSHIQITLTGKASGETLQTLAKVRRNMGSQGCPGMMWAFDGDNSCDSLHSEFHET
jgi:hypothetical protein